MIDLKKKKLASSIATRGKCKSKRNSMSHPKHEPRGI